jgi:hypothetical protein
VLLTASQIDPSLLPFLTADDAREEAAALARLNSEQIEPIVRRGVGYKFGFHHPRNSGNFHRPEFDEIYNDIQVRLLMRLRALKQDPAQNQIANLRGYVAIVTRNTCDEYLRNKYPLRRSLKDKIRHHLQRHSEFVVSEDADQNLVARLAAWNVENGDHQSLAAGQLRDLLQANSHSVNFQRLSLNELLTTIFALANAPVELDQLTAVVAELWAIEDLPVEALDVNASPALAKKSDADPVTIIEQRQLLQVLWSEICNLPRRQRVALLLNLRNPQGINIITLLPVTSVASFEQIAHALEIPIGEFEALWADLPLDDLRIATFLGATRQQVVNLRKTARERLLRRMSALK